MRPTLHAKISDRPPGQEICIKMGIRPQGSVDEFDLTFAPIEF